MAEQEAITSSRLYLEAWMASKTAGADENANVSTSGHGHCNCSIEVRRLTSTTHRRLSVTRLPFVFLPPFTSAGIITTFSIVAAVAGARFVAVRFRGVNWSLGGIARLSGDQQLASNVTLARVRRGGCATTTTVGIECLPRSSCSLPMEIVIMMGFANL